MGIIFSLFRRFFSRPLSNPVPDDPMSLDDQVQGPPIPLGMYQFGVNHLNLGIDGMSIDEDIPEPDPDHEDFDPDDMEDFVPPGCQPRASFFRNGFGR